MNNDSYFTTHQSSILIAILAILVAIGILVWISIAYHDGPFLGQSDNKGITDEEIQVIIESQSAPGSDNSTPEQKARMRGKTTATSSDSLTPEQKTQIINSTTAK